MLCRSHRERVAEPQNYGWCCILPFATNTVQIEGSQFHPLSSQTKCPITGSSLTSQSVPQCLPFPSALLPPLSPIQSIFTFLLCDAPESIRSPCQFTEKTTLPASPVNSILYLFRDYWDLRNFCHQWLKTFRTAMFSLSALWARWVAWSQYTAQKRPVH